MFNSIHNKNIVGAQGKEKNILILIMAKQLECLECYAEESEQFYKVGKFEI